MNFKNCVQQHADVLITVQGEKVTLTHNAETSEIDVIFYPLSEDDKQAGARRLNELHRGVLYRSSTPLQRGDTLTQADGTQWAVLPGNIEQHGDTLAANCDGVGAMCRSRVVYKGVING